MSQSKKRRKPALVKLDETWYLGADEHNFVIHRKMPNCIQAWKFWPRVEMALKWWADQALRDGWSADLQEITRLQVEIHNRIEELSESPEFHELMERKP